MFRKAGPPNHLDDIEWTGISRLPIKNSLSEHARKPLSIQGNLAMGVSVQYHETDGGNRVNRKWSKS